MSRKQWNPSKRETACLFITLLAFMLFMVSACRPDQSKRTGHISPAEINSEEALYQSYIQTSLTFKGDSLLKHLYSIFPKSYSNNYRIKGYRSFLEGYKLYKEKKPDSAEIILRNMIPSKGLDSARDYELLILHHGIALLLKLRHGANPATFASLMPALSFAEKYPSRFRWWIYDMAAEAWYWSGDADRAKSYILLGYKCIPDTNDYAVRGMFMDHLGRISFFQNNLREALKYEDSAYSLGQKAGDQKLIAASMSARADLMIRLGDTTKGYALQKQAFEENKRLNRQLLPGEYLNQAQSHYNKGNYDSAIAYGKQASEMAARDRLLVSTAYGIVAESFRRTGIDDSAFHYLKKSQANYLKYKEELQLSKINALDVQYMQEREKGEKQVLSAMLSKQRTIIIGVIVSLILAIVLSIVMIRQRRLRSELAGMELEQQLLRSQMDPHFTYSSLSNLQGLIRENEKDKAISYLNQFARLLRVTLENSAQPFVPLHEEVKALESYLSLQAMRLGYIFDYHIETYEGFGEDKDILIPPMLLQPFVENAVHHGLQNIGVKGRISVTLNKTDGILRCSIEDNGTGIQQKENFGKPSMSTGISKDRLRILAKKTGKKADLQIIDKGKQGIGTGTLVIIDIPYLISESMRNK